MNLRQIEAFRAVMVAGTVTGAAARLRISQPAVSRLISQLERTTKLALFVRSKQRVYPTPEALAFYSEVERAFIGIDKLERAAANIRNLVTGNLRIVSLPALGLGFLPHVIKRYRDMYPNVTVSLQTRSSSTVMDWVTALQFDLGLASNTVEKPSIKTSLFAATEGVCVLPPNHGLAAKSAITASDLRGEHFVSLSAEDQARFQIDHVFAEARVERQLSLETPYAATACAMVMEGLGVSIISPFTAEDFRGRGLLIKQFRPAIHFRTMLLQPAERPPSLAAEKFMTAMAQCRDELLQRHRVALHEAEPRRRAVSLIAT
jgi:DNA-binding transcriptional LysR family regulator